MNFAGKMNNEEYLNGIIHLMQTDTSVDAPASAITWSKNIFRGRATQPKQSLVQRIFAVLQMDLSPNQAAFGERSAGSDVKRQLLFMAGDNGVDIRVVGIGSIYRLNGQILGEGYDNAEVTLAGDGVSFTTKASELSEFKFENVSAGKYSLTVQVAGKEISVESIELS